LCAALFGNLLGGLWSKRLTTLLMGLNLTHILYLFRQVVVRSENYVLNLGNWIDNNLLVVNWTFAIDNLTSLMLIVVGSVSFFVHLYSTDYMGNDPHIARFMAYLSLFTFFMIILITGDNFILLFLGWEGVGLCSYLLISFWFTRLQANKSAIKALIVNRISDFALTFGLICIFYVFRSLDFPVVFGLIPLYINETVILFGWTFNLISVISLLLFIGAMGKSAQIGLHTWLPDAMEGPTPVSALIHAATMVTAGVFLLIKCSFIFEYAPKILVWVTFIGALTAFFSATVGLIQNDIKKVIAYSTCSQLGYMIFACGLSYYHVAFFHLSNHAFFKALLFLSAGSIIHSLSNEQDMRKYGALHKLLPFTSIMLLIGSLSLMGFPFLTGYYSKDLILELSYANYTIKGAICFWLGILTAFLTSIYSYRVFYLTFIYNNNSFKHIIANVHELPLKMAITLAILAFGSIFIGYIAKELFVGFGTDFWNQSIFILPANNYQFNAELIPLIVKFLPFFLSLIAIILVNTIFYYNISWINFFGLNMQKLYSFLSHKWYFDPIYNKIVNMSIFVFCYNNIFKFIDKGLLEHSGPHFFALMIEDLSLTIKKMQTGYVYRYGYFMVLAYTVVVIILDSVN
jgi:proton-translocating NADH-quinone oxidoreductase chain L